MMRETRRFPTALAALPACAYLLVAAATLGALACKIVTRYSFNLNEGWNAYWASAAWAGADLYPPPATLTFDNYPPLWFYLTGAVGHLVGDNILAGRAIAAAALLTNAAVVSLIVCEIAGAHRGWWLAGAAYLAMFGLVYQSYVAANDPQPLAGLLMTIAMLMAIRAAGRPPSWAADAAIVGLMIVAGLIKHSNVAVPASIALFHLLSGRPRALGRFVVLSAAGFAIACAGLFAVYGTSIFAALMAPRPYQIDVAWEQTLGQLGEYGALLAVIPFLALRREPGTRLVLICAVVALVQGAVLSGGYRVDVNVFFELLLCLAIGLGLMGAAVTQFIAKEGPRRLQYAAVACWLAITLEPLVLAAVKSSDDIGDAFAAVGDDAYEADLRWLRAEPGPIVCRDLALCYWAGQPLRLDLNNLRGATAERPALEDEVVARIDRCDFAVVELDDDWTDPVETPLTERMREVFVARYAQVRATQARLYWRPRCS